MSPSSVSWSYPQRWSTPCTTASVRSSVCSGLITTSPSSRGPAERPPSSTGKDSTSVGASMPRCSRFSSWMRAGATNSIARWPSSTPAASSAARAGRRSSSGTSMRSISIRAAGGPLALLTPGLGLSERRRLLLGVLVVCGDDPLHQLVADHVLAAEADELDALHLLEDLADHDEPGALVARQVDLRDVARHDHLRVEPEPSEEHLDLLRARVLRLVEDDEGVIQRVVCDEKVIGHVQRILSRHLNADSLSLAGRLDALDEAHRSAAAVL